MKTISKSYQVELEIKKSQFICRLFPAKDSTEAKEIIRTISTKYNDATHNCSAYIVIDGEAYDDDGEPSGTAGKPMLNVLKKNNLNNIVAIVTRYFGGIKLGAGGLVRAYGKSVIEALSISDIVEMEEYKTYELSFDYFNIKTIEEYIRNYNIIILNKEFSEKVNYKIAIKKEEDIEPFKEKSKKTAKVEFLNNEYLNLNAKD